LRAADVQSWQQQQQQQQQFVDRLPPPRHGS